MIKAKRRRAKQELERKKAAKRARKKAARAAMAHPKGNRKNEGDNLKNDLITQRRKFLQNHPKAEFTKGDAEKFRGQAWFTKRVEASHSW